MSDASRTAAVKPLKVSEPKLATPTLPTVIVVPAVKTALPPMAMLSVAEFARLTLPTALKAARAPMLSVVPTLSEIEPADLATSEPALLVPVKAVPEASLIDTAPGVSNVRLPKLAVPPFPTEMSPPASNRTLLVSV